MSNIERQVMASVGTIYLVRQLFSRTALKLYVCVVCLYGLGKLVWVARVFENLENVGFSGLANFALAAVLNTDVFVQLILVAGAIAFVSLVADLWRAPQGMRVVA